MRRRSDPEPDPGPPTPSTGTIRADLAQHEAEIRRRRAASTAAALASGLAAVVFVAFWCWRFLLSDLPPIPDAAALWSLNRPPGVTVLDRSGAVIGRRGFFHGAPLSLSDMPSCLPEAVLAAEDRDFYRHGALDVRGLVRAGLRDLARRKGPLQGGSTITQQLARALFLSPDQTLKRKVQEAALAFELEGRLTKAQILELYLNRVYFGAGAFGVDAAAETYFGTPARRLSLPQCALLAALPKAPSRLSPSNDFADALARSRRVIGAMVQAGFITPAQAEAALRSPPVLSASHSREGAFGWAFDLAVREARKALGETPPDLVIRLTLDAPVQEAAAEALRSGLAEFGDRGAREGALAALAPDGGVLALIGGADYRASSFDRATQALRQPGSAFKPFVYAAALEAGLRPDDVRADAPLQIGDWRPQNAEGRYAGPVTLSEALARSLNTVAVRVSEEVGRRNVAALARRFGLENMPADPRPPIALGAYEVTLLDLASAYQVFQQDGRRQAPFLILEVTNARGDVLYARRPPPPERVYDPGLAQTMVGMMRGVVERGTGRRADPGRPVAGKTGTSQDYRDAWFVGFTPELLAGVWVGDDQGRPMDRVAGGDAPAAIFADFVRRALADVPVSEFPLDPGAGAPAADGTDGGGPFTGESIGAAGVDAGAPAAGPDPAGAGFYEALASALRR